MEIAIEETIPTYSGGLGMLAGDTVRLQPTWNSNSSP
jgi:glucan phosphorylase